MELTVQNIKNVQTGYSRIYQTGWNTPTPKL